MDLKELLNMKTLAERIREDNSFRNEINKLIFVRLLIYSPDYCWVISENLKRYQIITSESQYSLFKKNIYFEYKDFMKSSYSSQSEKINTYRKEILKEIDLNRKYLLYLDIFKE